MTPVIWMSGNWVTLPLSGEGYPRFLSVARQCAASGVRIIAVTICGGVPRVKQYASQLKADLAAECPTCLQAWSPKLRIGMATSEVFSNQPLDGGTEHWEILADLCNWCYNLTGEGPIVDLEDSLLPWFNGTQGLNEAKFIANVETFAARCTAPSIYVYPSQWNGFERKRLVFQTTLADALLNRLIPIGTTLHSPDSLQHADACYVRIFESLLAPIKKPVEQIIVGPLNAPWWVPDTMQTALAAVGDREAWVYWMTPFTHMDPNVNLVAATLARLTS